ncbi:MAG TPA: bifunctional DNA primase/polymerase [Gemmataceae bacterium]|nr:bifunctional DNA primase/polymerase [Gemmataceae bacterium]
MSILANRRPGKRQSLLDHALGYASRGMSIIPVRGKLPAIKRWKPCQFECPTEDHLRQWFGNGTDITGIAVVLGGVSGGLTCRDYDQLDAYERWAAEHPDLAATLPTVQTARGRHVYCRSQYNRITTYPDGELRGAGYCLLPPSRHPSGRLYRWLVGPPDGELPAADPVEVGLAPRDGVRRLAKAEQSNPTQHNPLLTCVRECDKAMVRAAILDTVPGSRGQRHGCLLKLVQRLRRIMPDADASALRQVVGEWYSAIPPGVTSKSFTFNWTEFVAAWSVKPRAGDIAGMVADATKMPTSTCASIYDDSAMRLLVALCLVLQRHHGERPFFLSCRVASEAIGVGRTTVAAMLKTLAFDGIIEAVAPANREARKAAEWRFVGAAV